MSDLHGDKSATEMIHRPQVSLPCEVVCAALHRTAFVCKFVEHDASV